MSATEAASQASTGQEAVRPFQFEFPDADLADLKRRVDAARWPERETVSDDSQGVPLDLMQELARYWASEHDWGRCEARLNALPNFLTEIDGLDIHFIHVRSQHEDALPLIVTHGWPGSIIEQLKIIEPLTDPTAHGGSAGDAFDLVDPVAARPRLLGEADGARLGPGADRARLGRADGPPRIRALRRPGRRLGSGSHPDDGGAGSRGPARRALEHGGHRPARRRQGARDRRSASGGALRGRAARLRRARRLQRQARLLRAVHGDASADPVRPRRLARRPGGVHARPRRRDRPAGPRRKGPSAKPVRDGDLTRDDLLDNITLYWLTNTGVSSARLYWENKAPFFDARAIKLPMAISVFPDELYEAPRSWAERAYPDNLVHYNRLDRGGHFAAWEQPQLFSRGATRRVPVAAVAARSSEPAERKPGPADVAGPGAGHGGWIRLHRAAPTPTVPARPS